MMHTAFEGQWGIRLQSQFLTSCVSVTYICQCCVIIVFTLAFRQTLAERVALSVSLVAGHQWIGNFLALTRYIVVSYAFICFDFLLNFFG